MTHPARNSTTDRALRMVAAFEAAGKRVQRVRVDGRVIEVVLSDDKPAEESALEAWRRKRGRGPDEKAG